MSTRPPAAAPGADSATSYAPRQQQPAERPDRADDGGDHQHKHKHDDGSPAPSGLRPAVVRRALIAAHFVLPRLALPVWRRSPAAPGGTAPAVLVATRGVAPRRYSARQRGAIEQLAPLLRETEHEGARVPPAPALLQQAHPGQAAHQIARSASIHAGTPDHVREIAALALRHRDEHRELPWRDEAQRANKEQLVGGLLGSVQQVEGRLAHTPA